MSRAAAGPERAPLGSQIAYAVLALLLTIAAYVIASYGKRGQLPAKFAVYTTIFAAGYLGAMFVIRRYAPSADPALFPSAAVLVGLRLFLDAQWYVGVSNDRVAIFRGVPSDVAGIELHSVVVETSVPADQAVALPVWSRLPEGITANDRADAEAIVAAIEEDVAALRSDGRT